jgi:peptide-methionine (S)-S-oxide reductase
MPKYKTVCSGATDHAEAVKIEFDPGIVSYADLVGAFALFSGLWLLILERAVEFFYCTHDPTTLNQQGGDTATRK